MLAAAYPGIPAGYRDWCLEEKEAWVDNIGVSITYVDDQRRMMDPRTPEGVYHRTLQQTGDLEAAKHALTEADVQLKMANLPGGIGR